MNNYDIIIIGGGPAGFTAGIYAARGGAKVAVFTGIQPGGQAALTHKIENFSGVKDAEGYLLVNTMMEQAISFGAEVLYSAIEEVDFSGEKKRLVSDDGETYYAKAVIIATGAKNKLLELENEKDLIGNGISFCATCDGGFFKNKAVAVNGGGDTALTEALYLSNICSEVYLIHRRKGFRAAQILIDRVRSNPKIKLVLDSVVTSLQGKPLESIGITNKENGEKKDIYVSALFVAIGYLPNTEIFKSKINLNERDYITTNSKMETSQEGVFAAGDVRDTPMRQVITACADGAIAANSALEYLMS
ncbi:MAG: Thioredoxin reductase [Firmicutes bacterium ADurb.Bin080]|jgi:thioredoxin reductase (NADPH)|nr:thioredoxin-disulfide reductase [Clostridiales bacterium]OQC14775.1 MAG: Thioredoxin reductase [Firmicutes bacterium ADurb.Bin080]